MADSTSTVQYSFLCGLRGYHQYQSVWSPVVSEILTVQHERDNAHDRYAIAAFKTLPGRLFPSIVGHLPREISRFTCFILLHGARVLCQVVDIHHRRSPLVQGGLEIPVTVTVTMDLIEMNQSAIQKYETLVTEKYKEPVDGKFDDVTDPVLGALNSDEEDSDFEVDEPDV